MLDKPPDEMNRVVDEAIDEAACVVKCGFAAGV